MADVLTGSPFVSRTDEPHDRSSRLQKALFILVILLSLALVAELVYHLIIAPRLTISTIEFDNSTPISDEELMSIARIRAGLMYFDVETADLEASLEAVPVVRDASVTLSFPNSLRVQVTPRKALAWSIVQSENGQDTVVFDSEGVVFRLGLETSDGWMPVISGLRFPAAEPGLRLPALLVDFLESLRLFSDESPELFGLISEYRVVRKNDAAYEVVFYPMHFNVPVRIGRRIDAGMVQHVFMILEMLRREGRLEGITELDFRSGEGVLRLEGGDRG